MALTVLICAATSGLSWTALPGLSRSCPVVSWRLMPSSDTPWVLNSSRPELWSPTLPCLQRLDSMTLIKSLLHPLECSAAYLKRYLCMRGQIKTLTIRAARMHPQGVSWVSQQGSHEWKAPFEGYNLNGRASRGLTACRTSGAPCSRKSESWSSIWPSLRWISPLLLSSSMSAAIQAK